MQTADVQIGEPHSISAGLDYPGIVPQHAHLYDTKRVEFVNITDREAIEAGLQLSKLEGIIPALESSHALAWLEDRKSTRNSIHSCATRMPSSACKTKNND